MTELTTLPGRIDTEDVIDVLKKSGTLALGAIGGGLLKEKAIKPMIKGEKADLYATIVELGVGTLLAVFAVSKGPQGLFYPALGMASHAAGNLLAGLFGKLMSAEESAGGSSGGGSGGSSFGGPNTTLV